jgi:hypothetical protein
MPALHNVTLRRRNEMEYKQYFPCPVCKRVLVVEHAKTGKPYCKCNDCGVQLFIRGRQGIVRFYKMLGKMKIQGDTRDLINSVDYLNALKSLLADIRGKQPIIGENEDLNLQEMAVLRQIEKVKENLKEG